MSDMETRLAAVLRSHVRALTTAERGYIDCLRVPDDLSALYAKADREARIAIRRIQSMRSCAHLWPEEPWRRVPSMCEARKLSCVGPKAYRSLAGLLLDAEREEEVRAEETERHYRSRGDRNE